MTWSSTVCGETTRVSAISFRKVIDNDASCWHTLDPSTRLLTSDAPKELIERGVFALDETPAAGELIVRSEYMVDDVNTFAGLAARRVPVGILDHVTRGDPQRSARYRDLLLSADIPHELRGAFVIRGRVWGAVHIARRATSGAFQQRDADALAALTGAIGRGIRASLRFDAARRITGVEAPGMVVLGPHDEVELITPPARELLASLHPGESGYSDETIATPALALASFVRSAPDGGQGGGNVVTVPGSDGWVTLHASLPGPPDDGRVAIVLEQATGTRSATVRLEAFGATAREREVATLLARGLSRAEAVGTAHRRTLHTGVPVSQAGRSRRSVARPSIPCGSVSHPAQEKSPRAGDGWRRSRRRDCAHVLHQRIRHHHDRAGRRPSTNRSRSR